MKVLLCDNGMRGLLNFRGNVIHHFLSKGYEVVCVYPKVTHEDCLMERVPMECKCVQVSMVPTGMNPIADAKLLFEFVEIYRKEKPDIIFHYTIKPNIYGTLAARFCGIKSVAMVAGLGYMFNSNGIKQRIGRLLYKLGLNRSHKVFTLNQFIYDKLIEVKFVKKERLKLLQGGEGVDLMRFSYKEDNFETIRFLMIARVLYDKGYSEYVEAARIVRRKYPDIGIYLLGPMDEVSPMGVSKEILDTDVESGAISYLGVSNNVPSELSKPGTVIVLPSYHEGLSMSLIEACASGRPIITTDISGCRETVDDGENGFLVPVKNSDVLADAMLRFVELSADKKREMSRKSREKAEKTFDVKYVQDAYDDVIGELSYVKY